MRRAHGFTLIETAIAVFILVVAILAALGLEATSLKNSAKARTLQEAAAVSDRVFQELRTAGDLTAHCADLDGDEMEGLTVACSATPCLYAAGTLTCDDGVADPQLYDVAVEVRDGEKVLVRARSYIRPTLPLGGEGDGDGE
ncbi:type IV pilus modification PilV family protein [Oceanithermus sp.]